MEAYRFDRSYELLDRARQFIPNGIYGPRSPAFLTYGAYPCFLERGQGSHIWDVDGNEYIDYMCSFGTNILGLCNPEVDTAAKRQMDRGDCFTLPSSRWNEMAEFMVNQITGQDWVVFGKNGSDVTSFAATVARGFTGRKGIITAEGAYHGAHYWCAHNTFGIPAAYQEHVFHFPYPDLNRLRQLVDRYRGDIAAIMLTPYHHPALGDQVLPKDGFYNELHQICRSEGILFIMDDIRCGFRLDSHGSHQHFGADPDLICFGKAMANGYPIAALTGKKELQEAAGSAFFTGTHFFSGVPMAASMECIRIIERDGIIDKVFRLGSLLKKGMEQQAALYGIQISYTGHPAMPFMRFANDDDYSVNRYFCGEAAQRGVFLHPHHNWFISGAHSESDIQKTLAVTDECFQLTLRQYYR